MPQGQSPMSNAGGDEAFYAFAFTIVTVIALVMYSATTIRVCKVFGLALYNLTQGGKAQAQEGGDSVGNVLRDAKEYFFYLPDLAFYFLRKPALLTNGATLLLSQKPILMNVALPRFSRFVIRWKLIIVVLWVFLLSMALYSNLSFDGHKILGLSTDATEREIKKRYRVLSKQYHPDHNPGNQTSLQIYTQVVKAYKSLVNKEEFEEEARKEDLSVGVALPSFLTNRDNELIIKIVVLLSLIGLPLFVYKKFAGDDADKVQNLTRKIFECEMRMVPLLKAFGIPDEKKFHQLAAQVDLYTMCWKACGIPVQDPLQMEYLPPIEEFLKRSATPALIQQNGQAFAQMGIPGPDQVAAAAEFLKKGQEMLKEDEEKTTWSEEIKPISDSQFEVALYMMQLAMEDCEQYIAELNGVVNNSIQQIHKLSQHHQKMLEILVLNQQKKIQPKDQEGLRALARASKANALAILPAIQRTMQNFQRQQQAAMNGMKQQ